MGTDFKPKNKPANPAPPLNALKNPEVKEKEPVKYKSVYDEIAERRKREKHKIGVSSSEKKDEIRRYFGDEISDIIDEVKQNREDDDVKVYNPDKSEKKSNEIFSSSAQKSAEAYDENNVYDEEENFDIPIPKPKKRMGLWIVIISTLSVLCIIAAGMYGMVNGYFDEIISML